MSRIFTFGCSMTAYAWPTWPVILSYDLKSPCYNFAQPGMGNVGIFHMILYADMIYKFTEDDIILILWSSWSREDRIIKGEWVNAGSVFSEHFYDKKFIKRFWDYENDIVKNSSAIMAITKIYEKNILWQGTWYPVTVPEADDPIDTKTTKIKKFYTKHLPQLEFYNLEMPVMSFSGAVPDSHPDVKRHLNFVKEIILPRFGKTISQDTINKFETIHNNIEKLAKNYKNRDLDSLLGLIMKYVDPMADIYEFITHKKMDISLQDLGNH